jgi:hypothetical protein
MSILRVESDWLSWKQGSQEEGLEFFPTAPILRGFSRERVLRFSLSFIEGVRIV